MALNGKSIIHEIFNHGKIVISMAILTQISCMYRRLRSGEIRYTENPYCTYEMANDANSQYAHVNIQSEASAPAGKTQLPPSQPRSSVNDTTLFDNDLYI